jgi:hypothetical protein
MSYLLCNKRIRWAKVKLCNHKIRSPLFQRIKEHRLRNYRDQLNYCWFFSILTCPHVNLVRTNRGTLKR